MGLFWVEYITESFVVCIYIEVLVNLFKLELRRLGIWDKRPLKFQQVNNEILQQNNGFSYSKVQLCDAHNFAKICKKKRRLSNIGSDSKWRQSRKRKKKQKKVATFEHSHQATRTMFFSFHHYTLLYALQDACIDVKRHAEIVIASFSCPYAHFFSITRQRAGDI